MYAIIETLSNVDLNYKFMELFLAIANDESDEAPINLMSIDAFEEVTDENRQENTDLQNMAIFLLIANEIYGIKWGSRFYFGDVDMMDGEYGFDPDDATLIQLMAVEEEHFDAEFPGWRWEHPGVAIMETGNGYSVGFNADTICLYRTVDLDAADWNPLYSYSGRTRRQIREFCKTKIGQKYFPNGPTELLDLFDWINGSK